MVYYEATVEVKNHKNLRRKTGCYDAPVGMPLYWLWCIALGRAIDKLEDDERIVSFSVKEGVE